MRASGSEPVGGDPQVRAAVLTDLPPATLYAILRLRVDVFVVEQRCAYRELDGRDLEPTTWHLWVQQDPGAVCAYLRMLDEGDGLTRIGRVVTAPAFRGQGLAERLVLAAVARAPGGVVASVQVRLQRWYERLGFAVDGGAYVEDGIAHVPMRLPAEAGS